MKDLPKQKEGLKIGCLKTLNLALLAKCLWCLKMESYSLWSNCIKAWHNITCINGKIIAKASLSGTWLKLLNQIWIWRIEIYFGRAH